MLGWVVDEKAIEPHIPVFDKIERKDGTFEREASRHGQYRVSADGRDCAYRSQGTAP
jgi:hypothetical protein